MNYLFYAFGAAVAFAVSQIINKLLSKHGIDNKDSLMAYFMISTASFALILYPFTPKVIPPPEILSLLLAAVSAFLVGYYFFFSGIFHTDASSFSPLFQLQAGLVGIFAFIFLGERFASQNYFFTALMIIGGLLVSYTEKMTVKSFFNKGILLIFLMQVCHATSNVFIGMILKQISPVQLLFWEDIFVGVFACLFILLKRPQMKYSLNEIAPMFVSSYFVGVGVIALFSAFAVNLTISSAIGLLSAPIVFIVSLLASRFSPKLLEHHSSKVYLVRGIGLMIIMISAIKIALG